MPSVEVNPYHRLQSGWVTPDAAVAVCSCGQQFSASTIESAVSAMLSHADDLTREEKVMGTIIKLYLRHRKLLRALVVLAQEVFAATRGDSPSGGKLTYNERQRISQAFWDAYDEAT